MCAVRIISGRRVNTICCDLGKARSGTVSGSKTHTNNSVAVENVFDSPCAYQGRKNKLTNRSKLAKLLRNDIFLLLCFGYQPLTFGRLLGFRRIMKKIKIKKSICIL